MKKIMKIKKLSIALFLLLLIGACTKQEGYGGKSTIYGYVLEKDYNNSGQFQSEYYKPDQKVFIVFGDNDFYDDEIDTDYTGKYKFSYLYAGKYTLYTYTECSPIDPCDSGVKTVLMEVNISKNGDVEVLEDLVIENW